MLRSLLPAALTVMLLPAGTAMSTPLDGEQPAICSTLQVFSCDAGQECEATTVEESNAPQFLRVNFTERAIRRERPDGEEHVTPIGNIERGENRLILQGSDDGLDGRIGWNMLIRRADGRMTLAVAGDDVAFVLFGACTTATVAGVR
jgi:hypothetical protein